MPSSINSCHNLYASIYSGLNNKKLASEGIYIEQKLMKENCGSQDQIWAAYGGINFIKFQTRTT